VLKGCTNFTDAQILLKKEECAEAWQNVHEERSSTDGMKECA
jgi:hypothetical protein